MLLLKIKVLWFFIHKNLLDKYEEYFSLLLLNMWVD